MQQFKNQISDHIIFVFNNRSQTLWTSAQKFHSRDWLAHRL